MIVPARARPSVASRVKENPGKVVIKNPSQVILSRIIERNICFAIELYYIRAMSHVALNLRDCRSNTHCSFSASDMVVLS